MLGQLLHSVNPSRRAPQRPSPSLESVTEEAHTRNLIFPDLAQLHQHDGHAQPLSTPVSVGPTYDGAQAGIDLEQSRDVRIIVAQDEAGSLPRSVLFDSKPSTGAPESPGQENAKGSKRGGSATTSPTAAATVSHGRRSSLVSPGTAPRSPAAGGAFLRHGRSSSISALPNIDESATTRQKESEEIVKTCLDCMFGNTAMSYRGPSNKLHIIPLESKPQDTLTSPIIADGSSSFGKAEGRRRSNLAKSYTPTNPPPDIPSTIAEYQENPPKDRRRTILITRTFSIALPDEHDTSEPPSARAATSQGSMGTGTDYPFPQPSIGSVMTNASHRRPKTRRPPMYGITLVLHLPVSSSLGGAGPSSRSALSTSKPGSKTGSSLRGIESLGSSLDSDRRGGWAFVDSAFGSDSFLSASFSSDVDDRVDVIGKHWDVVARTLTSLQFVVQDRILDTFRAADVKSPPVPESNRPPAPLRLPGREPPVGSPRRAIKLQPYALAFDDEVKKAADVAAERVVKGVRIPRVVTGQGRWGVWREEARTIGRWANSREQNFFFFNLLTAFLGSHTEWLSVLGPRWYRRRHHEQQRSNAGEDLTIANRTVIVSLDKMSARRLIFLLSAFLPASYPSHGTASPLRPSTSASFRAYSQSPPNQSTSRQPSLRRTINRRAKGHPHLSSSLGSMRDHSPFNSGSIDDKTEIARSVSHSRRPSETRSIMSEFSASSGKDVTARKNSATTTTTVTPENAPVTHFSIDRADSTSGAPVTTRPDFGHSLASANLRQTLHRNNSATQGSTSPTDSHSNSRWGSLASFWSGGTRRASSTEASDTMQLTTDDGYVVPNKTISRPSEQAHRSTLEQMVREVEPNEELYPHDLEDYDHHDSDPPQASPEQSTPPHVEDSSNRPHPRGRAIPARPQPSLTSPLRLSVNEDGVVDVSVPMLGSPLQSPNFGGLNYDSSFMGSSASLVGADSSTFTCVCPHHDHDQRVNVAGWLARFHADFALQGVTPYPELESQIRAAMSAEPTPTTAATTPALEAGPTEKWVDVCSTLIADTGTFTIKRLCLRRRVRLIPAPVQPGITSGPHAQLSANHNPQHPHQNHHRSSRSSATADAFSSTQRSQYGNPYATSSAAPALPMTELHLEEVFTEEPVMDMDDTLVRALESVLEPNTIATPRNAASAAGVPNSRSTSRRGRRDRRAGSDVTAAAAAAAVQGDRDAAGGRPTGGTGGLAAETQRQDCRKKMLGALENVAKLVADELTSSRPPKHQGGSKRNDATEADAVDVVGGAREGQELHQETAAPNIEATLPASFAATRSTNRDERAGVSTLTEGVRKWLKEVEASGA